MRCPALFLPYTSPHRQQPLTRRSHLPPQAEEDSKSGVFLRLREQVAAQFLLLQGMGGLGL